MPKPTDQLSNNSETTDILEIKRKSISGVVSFFLRTLILQGIGLLSVFILSAFFSPEDFGVYGFVTQIIGLLIFFSDIGLAASLVQKKSDPTETDYASAFTLQQILSWIIVLVTVGLAQTDLVVGKIGQAGVWVLLSLGLSFPLASLKTIPSIKLERKLEFSKLVLPQIVEQLVFHTLLILLAWKNYGVIAYAYAIIARSVIGVVTMWFIFPWKLRIAFDRNSLKGLLGFGVKFQLNDFLARIKDQLFFLALGLVLPLREFGYLQWSKNWSMYPYNLTVQNVMSITFPTFSRLQGHPQLLKRAIEKSLFFISLFLFPLLVGMSVFIWPLTQVIDKYQKWEPSVPSFIFFTLSIMWAGISTPLVNTLNAIGKINRSLRLMVIWTLLTWILSPILLYFYGFNGIALAALLISFTSILSVLYVKQEIPVQVLPQVWKQTTASVLMGIVGFVGLSFWARDILSMLVGVLLCASVYLITFLVLGWKQLVQELSSLRMKPATTQSVK